MKKMKIEKQLIFADQVLRIVSLQVQENLTYRHEEDGIRAMGPLYIKGEYEGIEGIEQFQETLELDVLAPNDKLGRDPFRLSLGEYQGKIQDDSIHVMITMDIQGLREDGEAMRAPLPETEATPLPEMPKEMAISKPQETPMAKEVQPNTPDVEEESTAEEAGSVDDFEDMFSDGESTYTSYRIIVAKPNDTYAAIAQRYEVDESALRDTNKNKEILAKTLVILPFQKNELK